ncbi:MAG: Polyketide synthase modules and related proteins [uncultured Blastococcus sp.]|uniref:Polyketide synthase modules and related proteins n=1 Tax=uncultured Blastococcus sp. TaxID=217144 RepID=A0A6J4HZH1_9ACTN|nr:MAG: Polyketide synthase modules and related proteins [uncultured Blastococcus sp.]
MLGRVLGEAESLPAPAARPHVSANGSGDPAPDAESDLARVLAEVLDVDQVLVDGNFFDDLGADSMVMARFCARVRKRADLPSVSMKDVYQHPTIASLSASIAPIEHVRPPAPTGQPVAAAVRTAKPVDATARVGPLGYVLCGVLQFLAFLGYAYASAMVAVRGAEWIANGSGLIDNYLRAVVYGGAAFLGLCTLPVVVKWLLVGQWKRQEIRVWSLAYFRFWLVKTLVRMNPLVLLFAGSPLFVLYLRALGAKVGRGVAVFAHQVPVCTDLLTIGDGTVISKDALLPGYHAVDGVIRTGPITLGRDVFISESTVIDIETSMGDGAQLGHRSSLIAGQSVPAGESWHGSPGRRTDVNFRSVGPADCGTMRRVVYSVLQLITSLLLTVPLAIGGLALLLVAVPQLDELLTTGTLSLTSAELYWEALIASSVLLVGSLLVGLLLVTTVPRLLHLAVMPGRVHPLYGFHYSVHRAIVRTTNVKPLVKLFGDSSYIVNYLQWIGYHLAPVIQTGSNFGTGVKHENPHLSTVGTGTMVADGLSIMNAEYSSSSFRTSAVRIGAHNFLGNVIAYPAGARIGDNCLLATKVMVPIDGPIRENVGLLGSPAFEIPRTVYRDARFDGVASGQAASVEDRLRAKNRHNRHTVGLFLLVRWMDLFAVTLIALVGASHYDSLGAGAVAASSVVSLVFHVFWTVLVERASTGFRPLQPQLCSIHDITFWRHERYWKLVARPEYFNGTPFKNLMWRLLGVRIGRRVFDDGCSMPERTLVTVGDECTLNLGSALQAHSQEDGGFKSDRITIGAGVTVGVGAWVHYGVTMGDGSWVAPDSFLMKGEQVPPHARWGGNPAGELSDVPTAPHPPRHGPAVLNGAGVSVDSLLPAGARRRPTGRHRATERPTDRLSATGPRHG